MVATDLFEIRNSKYLLLLDYCSRFPVLCKLGSTTSRLLVQEMKTVFAKLGVPKVIVSDGGPQYTSAEFKDFMKEWQIDHQGIPSQMVWQRCLQTMKALLIKTMEEGEYMDLALLTYKTAPLSHRLLLPAQFLNSRKYKTLLAYSTNKTPRELQTDHRPRKTNTVTAAQQEHQSAANT